VLAGAQARDEDQREKPDSHVASQLTEVITNTYHIPDLGA
jgi:hypothetical protein